MYLLNLSGGIDSANCAYHLLKQGKRLLIHHCEYHNRMQRGHQEKTATLAIVSWLRSQGLSKFEYIESKIEVSDFRYKLYDIELLGFLSAGLFRMKRNRITNIVISESLDDFEQSDFHIRHQNRMDLINVMCKDYGDVNIIFPNKEKSRTDIIKDTPIDILKLCWYCRRPHNGLPCKQSDMCKTCVKTIPVLIEMGLMEKES
jgi:7-cyano-7-deazaguanine synthase in queuosine biosynthesis